MSFKAIKAVSSRLDSFGVRHYMGDNGADALIVVDFPDGEIKVRQMNADSYMLDVFMNIPEERIPAEDGADSEWLPKKLHLTAEQTIKELAVYCI